MRVFLTPRHVGQSDAGTRHDYEKMSCKDVWGGGAGPLKHSVSVVRNFPQGTADPGGRFHCDMGLARARNGLWV